MNTVAFSILCVALYIATATLLGKRLHSGISDAERATISPKWASLWAAALVFHAIALQQDIFTQGGVNLGFFNALSLFSWLIALLLLLTALREPVANLGIVMLPLAAVFVLLEYAFPSEHILFNRNALAAFAGSVTA